MKHPLLSISLLAFTYNAYAIPNILDYSMLEKSSAELKENVIYYSDSLNNNRYYVPYDVVKLTRDGSHVNYSMTFSKSDARIWFQVYASYSSKAKKLIRKLRSEGKLVTPLPVKDGSWTIGIKEQDNNDFINLGNPEELETPFPSSPVSYTVFIEDQKAIEAYSHALRTNASLSIRYDYSFRAAVKPSTFTISANWRSIYEALKNSIYTSAEKCKTWSNGLDRTKGCIVQRSIIHNFSKKMISSGKVSIEKDGDFSESEEALFSEYSDLVSQIIFKNFTENNSPVNNSKEICYDIKSLQELSECDNLNNTFTIKSNVSFKNDSFSFKYINNGNKALYASISSTLPGICDNSSNIRENITYINKENISINGCDYLESTDSSLEEISSHKDLVIQ